MDEASVIAIARIAVQPHAKHIMGLDSVRKTSPAQIVREALERGAPDSEIPELFRTKRDYWAVYFRLKISPDECWCPSTICVHVDDETGAAHLRRGL